MVSVSNHVRVACINIEVQDPDMGALSPKTINHAVYAAARTAADVICVHGFARDVDAVQPSASLPKGWIAIARTFRDVYPETAGEDNWYRLLILARSSLLHRQFSVKLPPDDSPSTQHHGLSGQTMELSAIFWRTPPPTVERLGPSNALVIHFRCCRDEVLTRAPDNSVLCMCNQLGIPRIEITVGPGWESHCCMPPCDIHTVGVRPMLPSEMRGNPFPVYTPKGWHVTLPPGAIVPLLSQ